MLIALERAILESGRIDLWLCTLDSLSIGDDVEHLLAVLSEDELIRHDRYVFDKDKRMYSIAKYLLRNLLSSYFPEVSPTEWSFSYGEQGKPELAFTPSQKKLYFNISHTQNLLVLAFSHDAPLGVDVEHFSSEEKDLSALARHSFSVREYQQIERLRGGEFRDRFYALWTLKEAYMKADGRGMLIPLKSFSFDFGSSNDVLQSFDIDGIEGEQNWHFWQYDTPFSSFLSLAMNMPAGFSQEMWVNIRQFTSLEATNPLTLPLKAFIKATEKRMC